MATRKHHFARWHNGAEESTSHCTACGVQVRIRRGEGGTKFLVRGKWVRRTPCLEKKPC